MRTAVDLGKVNQYAGGDQRLYRLDPPIVKESWYEDDPEERYEYVVVSAVVAYSGPETYIFPADKDGNITDWGELDGSYRGGMDHEAALANAGYTVTQEAPR